MNKEVTRWDRFLCAFFGHKWDMFLGYIDQRVDPRAHCERCGEPAIGRVE